jgi:serine/threonine protein kinase/Flp pilus assembly protein TadD
MGTPPNWYLDHEQLVAALREGRQGARGQPTIPGYDDLHELRRGGQGVVFQATQRSTKRQVAIKVLLHGAWASESQRRRFEREIDLIAGLHHPNIVRLYDSGVTEAGYPYYVMEYIEGTGLDELLAVPEVLPTRPVGSAPGQTTTQRLPAGTLRTVRGALELFGKVCDAVSYAHQRGVIHRDLKPSNIRIDPDGEPYVLDFGLAKLAAGSPGGDQPAVSHTGQFMGSPPWASPEQALGDPHGADVRSDVYALGVILYQVLTGRFPYPVGGGLHQVLSNIQSLEPPRPSSLRRELDDEIDTIVLKCLSKPPDRRYQSAGELARDLRHYLSGEPIEAKRDSTLYTLRKTLRRYEYAARAASVVLVISLAAAVVMTVYWQRAREAEQLADQRLDAAEKARAGAVTARDQAQKESAQTRAINQFLIDLLTTPLDLGREARVADLLDRAVTELLPTAPLDAATEAPLREALGNAYASLGLFAEAEPQLYQARELWQHLEGEQGPDTLAGLSSIAWLLQKTGKLDESEALFRQVLEARRRVLGEDHLNTTRTMNDLACVLESQGRLKEAEDLHRQALANLRARLGPQAPDTLTSMGNLASVLCSRGRLEEAGTLMRERLQATLRILGPEHRDTLRAMGSLARLHGRMGDYQEAARLSREVFEAERRILGEDHPETLASQSNLALALSAAGRLEEAEPLLRDAVARSRRTLGSEHPDTLTAISSLAALLNTRGQYAESESLLRQALEIARRTSGPEHVDTLYAMNNLARCLQLQGKLAEAESLYRDALAACLSQLGEENPFTLRTMTNLGVLLIDCRRFDQAEPLIRSVEASCRRLFGDEHIDTLHAELQLGILLHERGDFQAAEQILAPLLETVRRVMSPGHWYPAVVQGWYGGALVGLGQYDRAEEQLQAAHQKLQSTLGDQHPRTRKLRQRLTELYEAWGRPEQAERYRDQLPLEHSSIGVDPGP